MSVTALGRSRQEDHQLEAQATVGRFCPKTQKQIGKTSQWLNVIESDNLSSLEAPWWKERTHPSVVL